MVAMNQLVNTLAQAGIQVFVDEGKLKTRAEPGAITPELATLIRENKQALVPHLSALAQSETAIAEPVVLPPLTRQRDSVTRIPLSWSQQRLWFIDRMNGASPEYHLSLITPVGASMKDELIAQALVQLVRQSDALRTVYREDIIGAFQIVTDDVPTMAQFMVSDAQAARERISTFLAKPFQLDNEIPFRAALITTKNGERQLVIGIHHIAVDGWSMNTLHQQFQSIYQQLAAGDVVTPSEDTLQYADFALWQHALRDTPAFETSLAWWQQQLADLPAVHGLPLDYVRPKRKQNQGALLTQTLDHKTCSTLINRANQLGVTPFMLLHGLVALVFARFSGDSDSVIGVPVANRQTAEMQDIVGCFINTLVLRLQIPQDKLSDTSVSAFIDQLRTTHLTAQQHQHIPFDMLVETLKPEHTTAHNPLFQLMLTTDNTGQATSASQRIEQRSQALESQALVKFDLTIEAQLHEQGGQLNWRFDTRLFNAQTITSFNDYLLTMIDRLLAISPDTVATTSLQQLFPVSTDITSIHTEVESVAELPADSAFGVQRWFEKHAQRQGDDRALVVGDESLSYAELDQRANQLAHYLIEVGATDNGRIGISVKPGVATLLSILAVLKTGSAYVPIDAGLPEARAHWMVQDAGLDIVITDQPLAAKFVGCTATQQLNLDDPLIQHLLAEQSSQAIELAENNDRVAYIIYTSGTTGTPKGVLVTHRNLVNYTLGMQARFNIAHGLNYGLVTSIATDLGNTALFLSLMVGGTLHVFNEQQIVDATFMQDYLRRQPLDLLKMTPSHFAGLYPAQDDSVFAHTVIIGGEKSDSQTQQKLRHFLQHCLQHNQTTNNPSSTRLIHHFGPTETTIGCCATELTLDDDFALMPLGEFLPGQHGVVVSKSGDLLPAGAVGELWVSGAGVAAGYLNNPSLTADKFVTTSFTDAPAERFYRTGDKVRLLPSGELIFLGRIDQQVKIRGYRVELAEVEYWLNQCELVAQGAVVVNGHQVGHRDGANKPQSTLVAYVVPATQHKADERQIRQALTRLMPGYMVPAQVVCLDKLPLKSNGKLDRGQLPAIVPGSAIDHADVDKPATDTEKTLAEIWSVLLTIPVADLHRQSDFFELGGHSLLVIRLLSQIRALLDIELTVEQVFEQATLQALANQCEQQQGGFIRGDIERVSRQDSMASEQGFITSFAQQRMWYIDALQGGSPEYNMPKAWRVSGPLNIDAVEQALQTIVQRHETLRTSFHNHDDLIVQRVADNVVFSVQRVDLTGKPQQEKQIEQLINAERQFCFDLATPLKIRASVVQLADNDFVLLLNLHHIASDGWSNQRLVQEFTRLYRHFATNESQRDDVDTLLPPLAVQYLDYANWQRNWLQGDVLQQQVSYWLQQLDDVPGVHSLPLANSRPADQRYQGIQIKTALTSDVSARLRTLASQLQITPFMLFHGVLALVFSRHSASTDIVMGTPVANRLHQDVESLIGLFVNTVVLRLNTENTTLANYFRQVRDTHLGAQTHQDIPFEQLVEHCVTERSLNHSPLFQIMFSYDSTGSVSSVGGEQQDVSLDGLEFAGINSVSREATDGLTHTVAKFDLDIGVHGGSDGFTVSWIYDRDLFSHEQMTQMCNHYLQLLTGFADLDGEQTLHDTQISDMSMFSPAEWHGLVHEPNQTSVSLPDGLIQDQIQRIAQQKPNDIALWHEDETMSWQQLDHQSSQLAHYLKEQGIVPGDFVGIYHLRSIPMMVATFAILKVGAAYVPLDTAYPQERLAYITADAGLKRVLTAQDLTDQLSFAQSVPCCFSDTLDLSSYPTSAITLNESPDTLVAYMIYTSGSTGQPKGVAIPHQGVLNLAISLQERYQLTPEDRVVQFASFSFDMSVEEIFGALCNGCGLILRSDEWMQVGDAFWQYCERYQASVLNLPTSFFHALMADNNRQPASCIRMISVGGEKLSEEAVQIFFELSDPKPRLFNAYGPTEYSVDTLIREVDPAFKQSIGFPLANTQVYVLDPHGLPAPDGALGELCIAGAGLALGYHNKPEQTAKAFVRNPFAHDGAQRMYKTGDLVRYASDGSIDFIGRVDNQIKLRGFRIELGEIERTLQQLPNVQQACVALHQNGQEPARLVGWIQPAVVEQTPVEPDTSSASALITTVMIELERRLPAYMVPSVLLLVDEFALTPNGKIDRKALPEPSEQSGAALAAPESETEQTVAAIWAGLLGLELNAIGLDSNFFELGGHSLLLIRLISLLQQQTGLQLELRQVYQYGTVRTLAAFIDFRQSSENATGVDSCPTDDFEQLEF